MQNENIHSFHSVPTVKYGRGALQEVGLLAKQFGTRVLIVSDPVIEQLGILLQCKEILEANGLYVACYTGVTTEPVDQFVAEGLAMLQQQRSDVIVSIGGGSCIDTAKAIAVVATNGNYIGDYMHMQKLATIPAIPHIAIPTTAGTGSEATDVTVITNTQTEVKMMIKQPAFMPCAAIVDPLLSATAPASIVAATGIDALSHAIESYISRRAHSYSNMLALSAMELISHNLLVTYEEPLNLVARENMALAAMQAGASFSNASVALVHGMSRPIGALFHVPHGISNAMLLPLVLEYSKDTCVSQLAKIGAFFTNEVNAYNERELAEIAIASIKGLCHKMHITNLRDYGIEESAFMQALDKMATDALASGSPANNPRVPSFEELKTLYRLAYHYEF